VDVGIWYPFGNIKTAFRTDFPVSDEVHTLGDPTFYTFDATIRLSASGIKYPNRQRGSSEAYVLGGMHMTFAAYLPLQLIKGITCTECHLLWDQQKLEYIADRIRADELVELEKELGKIPPGYEKRMKTLWELGSEMKETAILPWFYACNRRRYPVWEGKHDSRLQ